MGAHRRSTKASLEESGKLLKGEDNSSALNTKLYVSLLDPYASLMTTSHLSEIQVVQNKNGEHLPRLHAFACSYFNL